MAKTPRGKSFDDHTNEALRKIARDLVREHGSAKALALAIGVSQPTISTFISGKNGAGPELATKLADARGQTLSQLLAGAAPGVTRNAMLPGWTPAREAAEKASGLPAWCFDFAATRQAIKPELRATKAYVLAEAQIALTYVSEDEARRLTSSEIDEKTASSRKHATKP